MVLDRGRHTGAQARTVWRFPSIWQRYFSSVCFGNKHSICPAVNMQTENYLLQFHVPQHRTAHEWSNGDLRSQLAHTQCKVHLTWAASYLNKWKHQLYEAIQMGYVNVWSLIVFMKERQKKITFPQNDLWQNWVSPCNYYNSCSRIPEVCDFMGS